MPRLPACRFLGVLVVAGWTALQAQGGDKTILVSVIDADGKPVTDVTAANFAVREDGVDRDVLGMTLSKAPLHVVLLIDTTAVVREEGLRTGVMVTRETALMFPIVFHEEGESANSTDRSQLQNLLTFCRLNKGRVHFLVVFNLTRFARDKYDHFALRSHLQSLGIFASLSH